MSRSSEHIFGEEREVLAAAYGELQNLLLEGQDVTAFLTEVAELAASVVPDSSCGITLRRDTEVATVASSDEFATQVDEIQYGRGQGPCLQSLHTGEEVAAPDLSTDDRWSDYRIHALIHGVRSSLSLPLRFEQEAVLGALNLYARTPHAFGELETSRARNFARQASTALTLVLRRAEQQVLEEQLRDALATRGIIDQALGMIMAQQRVSAADAFALLREASQAQNRKLAEIAATLIETLSGHPPTPPRPFTDPR